MQHLAGHESHHRRAMEKRQIRRVVTTVVTERETTFTSVFTTRAPLIPLPTDIFGGDDEDEDEKTTTTRSSARPSSTSSTPSARPSSSAPTSRPTSTSSSASSSVVPSSSSSVITSRPAQSTSSDALPQSVVTSVVNETRLPSPSPSSTDLSASDAVGGAKSAGQIVGIVVGVVAGVIGVAIFAAFIVRHMRKRANDKEAWSAAKFRQSALMLNDDNNNNNGGGGPAKRGPRPPSMIERRGAANTASIAGAPPAPSRAYPYTDAPAGFNPQDQLGYNRVATPHQPQQYGAPNPYGAAPMAYSGQNMYGQGADRGYGMGMNPAYGAAAGYGHPQQGMDGMMDMHHPGFPSRGQNGHNSLPPFAAYAPRHEMDSHAFGAAAAAAGGMMQRNNTTASNFPNPFSERAPAAPTAQSPVSPRDSGSSGRGSSESGHVQSNQPRFMTRNGDEDDAQDSRDAPPAYTDDGSYAKMQRDVKTPVVMSVEGTRAPSAAPVPAGTPAPATTTMGNNKARPMSSHTVYDPSDAYGGM